MLINKISFTPLKPILIGSNMKWTFILWQNKKKIWAFKIGTGWVYLSRKAKIYQQNMKAMQLNCKHVKGYLNAHMKLLHTHGKNFRMQSIEILNIWNPSSRLADKWSGVQRKLQKLSTNTKEIYQGIVKKNYCGWPSIMTLLSYHFEANHTSYTNI